MSRLLPVLLLPLLLSRGLAAPWDELRERDVSRSHQFIVYASDPSARAAIAMAVEDAKDKMLRLLGLKDGWKHPIVVQVKPVDPADPGHPVSDVQIVNTDEGFKVELNVLLDSNPREAHFPQQLIRSILLEYMYRNQRNVLPAGVPYAEPPAWLVDGFASLAADPDSDANSSLFRSLISGGKTPTLADFLAEKPVNLDTPSMRLYSACSMSLVRLLLGLDNGQVLMQNFIRHWPGGDADPEAELVKAFPMLNSGGQSLEKWWTLGLASLAAADRYQGFSLEETSQQLDEALKLAVEIDNAGGKKIFTLDQYADFEKAPGATAALDAVNERLLGLEGQGNPIMREVIGSYQAIVANLIHHKSHHLKERLDEITEYRKRLATRMDQIADYLNWYEATQRSQASGSFDEYIRTANRIESESVTPRTDPVSKYMDSMERQLSQ